MTTSAYIQRRGQEKASKPTQLDLEEMLLSNLTMNLVLKNKLKHALK